MGQYAEALEAVKAAKNELDQANAALADIGRTTDVSAAQVHLSEIPAKLDTAARALEHGARGETIVSMSEATEEPAKRI